MEKLPEAKPKGHWVQTEREAHEAWAALMRKSPRAAELLHLLVARVGDHNAVVVSQKTLAAIMDRNPRTIKRAVRDLVQGNWIEVRQIGDTGTVNAYVINDRVAWTGRREGMRYSLFSAAVVVSDAEQPDEADLGAQEPLRELPSLFPGERQLPSGDGLAPPSEPAIPGLEPDLPARRKAASLDE
ncbi:helix-turn-helix domain-containing protein [Thioclava sediminum]|uniref:Helix-turn-helix domain-containing protein n=1 Tax=Thioclava sediminum TaxID=1915319 RepID=A0ABX3MVG6_9RHOB|nr:helix-turn-helix domain-containing protein [Thioclava sediminum]OOY22460.1 helix-turn-helix domain-containing protein [Thioclava sediminum]